MPVNSLKGHNRDRYLLAAIYDSIVILFADALYCVALVAESFAPVCIYVFVNYIIPTATTSKCSCV